MIRCHRQAPLRPSESPHPYRIANRGRAFDRTKSHLRVAARPRPDVVHKPAVDSRKPPVDYRKQRPQKSTSRTGYPVDYRKTKLIESFKYSLLIAVFRESTLRSVENPCSIRQLRDAGRDGRGSRPDCLTWQEGCS